MAGHLLHTCEKSVEIEIQTLDSFRQTHRGNLLFKAASKDLSNVERLRRIGRARGSTLFYLCSETAIGVKSLFELPNAVKPIGVPLVLRISTARRDYHPT